MSRSRVPSRPRGVRAPRPPQPRLPRERLVGRLRAIPPGGAAVLVAPAGYGATSLLALAAEGAPVPVVWISGQASTGGAEFWRQLCEGLAAVGVAVPELPRNARADRDALVRGVAELVASASDGPDLLLVVDDLPRDEVVEAMVQQVVDERAPSVRVMISARATPGLDLSRLSGTGRLTLLDGADLALSREESEQYLRMVAPDLPADRRAALAELADGWIAALRAATSATGSDPGADPAAWLLGPGLELLLGRGLQALDPLDRELLVVSSVLDQLSPEACDALLGRSDSAERLVTLRERLLVRRVPGPGPARYETHPLLRELLGRKLSERGRGALARAHEEAGLWLAAQGDAERGISHLLDSGRIDRAREVLASHVGDLFDTGRAGRVRTWYRQAPELAVPDQQLLLLGAAWAESMSGDLAAARPHLLELEAAAAALATAEPDALGAVAASAEWLRVETRFLRFFLETWTGNTGGSAEQLRVVRAGFGAEWSRMVHQSSAFFDVRLSLWHGDTAAARRALQVLSGRPGTLHYFQRIMVPSLGALLAGEEGRAHRACFLADSALEALEHSGRISVVDGCDARLARVWALADLGEVGTAAEEAAAVHRCGLEFQHVPYTVLGAVARARALAAGDQPTAAGEQVEAARLALSRHGVGGPLAQVVNRVEAEVAIAAGNRPAARRLVQRLAPGRFRDLLAIRVLAMGGAMTQADVVSTVRNARPESPREVVDARLAMAALTAAARRSEAEMHLRAAAVVAHEQGMLLALRGRAEEVVILAEQVALAGTDPAVAALVGALRRPAEEEKRPVPALSSGELQLLDRLAVFPGNRELAQDLGISTNTLKTRLRRLYAKLGVHDRAAALRAAGRPG